MRSPTEIQIEAPVLLEPGPEAGTRRPFSHVPLSIRGFHAKLDGELCILADFQKSFWRRHLHRMQFSGITEYNAETV